MSTDTKSFRIGVIFTPLDWAFFASKKFNIYNSWMNGSTIFDPTMGNGNLLASLIEMGLKNGVTIEKMPINNLYGNELNSDLFEDAINRFKESYGIDMNSNFTNCDFFELEARKYDILFGNPPWMNFTKLPSDYKRKLKPLFIEYGLAEDAKKMLLGRSRIDVSALVIQKAITDFLHPNGEAYFFQPLSLLLNDGAHDSFRNYHIKGDSFSVKAVYDFNQKSVFPNVSTRHGLVHYKRNEKTNFPISYWVQKKDKWTEHRAAPLLSSLGPLSVFPKDAPPPLFNFKPIDLHKDAMPRQGINTSGANGIFFFNSYEDIDATTCRLNKRFLLPKKFIFPLLVPENFKNALNARPKKWVLLPYSKDGRPLEMKTIIKYPLLWKYLKSNKDSLNARKGQMIQTWKKRGYWWALLGVGKYNFSKHKVVWEAYGRKTFKPTIFSDRWQVNQSLQAYVPLQNKKEAKRILKALKDPAIEHYLHSLKMDGTMNWAQPGKIKKLFYFFD